MKRSLLPLFAACLLLGAVLRTADAQKLARVDTLSIGGVRVGMSTEEMGLFVHAKLDTMLWGGGNGASMFSFKCSAWGVPGEIRIATDPLGVTQVTFVASTSSAEDAAKRYPMLAERIRKAIGTPDDVYDNTYHITTWHGFHQDLKLNSMDGSNYLTATLMKAEKLPESATAKEKVSKPTLKRRGK